MFSAEEAAGVLGASPLAVRVAQHRALQKLRTAPNAKTWSRKKLTHDISVHR